VFGVSLNEEVPGSPDPWEQLWGRRVGDLFEVCCIPFLAYDLALGDLVALDEDLRLREVREAGGHRTYRIWFGSASPAVREQAHADLSAVGALFECRGDLMAVDATDGAVAEQVWAVLMSLTEHGVEIEGPFSGGS
jgi:hypothetical protein